MSNFVTPDNGRRIKKGDPEGQAVYAKMKECAEKGERYPERKMNDFYDTDFFWMGRMAYDAVTLERLRPTGAAKRAPLALPTEWIIDGEARLPGEGKEFYERYLMYRDLGPERTFGQMDKLLGHHGSNIRNVAARYHWADRVKAYDLHMEVEARKAAQRVLEEQMAVEVKRRDTYLKNEWEVVEKGFGILNEMLKYPVVEQESSKTSADGKTTITVWKPGKWTYAAMAQLMEAITKIGRLNTGLTTPAGQKPLSGAENGLNKPEMSQEESEMHAFAAQRAEEAYFAALDEWKARKNAPERQPLTLKATVAA